MKWTYEAQGAWTFFREMLVHSDDSSMTIRTACSASLVALHEACGSLLRGDCQAAIVGGANLIMFPGMTQSLSEQQVLSEDGSCKTFSADANGYARGEAIDAIYIKRLDTAIKDGNPIRAIIRGTASNHDGRTLGLSVPNVDAQEASIRRAYEVAGIKDHSETGFVECHGTGTPIGLSIARVQDVGASTNAMQGIHSKLRQLRAYLEMWGSTLDPSSQILGIPKVRQGFCLSSRQPSLSNMASYHQISNSQSQTRTYHFSRRS